MRRTVKQSIVAVVAAVTATAGALALPAASAAVAPPPRTGSLGQLPGSDGCVQDTNGAASDNCGSSGALKGAGTTVLSPDGSFAFVAGTAGGGSITSFSRDAVSGVLTQTACATATAVGSCTVIADLNGLYSMTVNSDGSKLYAAMPAPAPKVVSLDVSSTGGLSRTSGPSGCVQNSPTPTSSCSPGSGIPAPDAVALSSDDATLYVASYSDGSADGSVAAFDLQSGTPVFRSCVQTGTAVPQCQAADGLFNPVSLALSPDDASIYVASFAQSATGAIADLSDSGGPGPGGLSEDGCYGTLANCTAAHAVNGAVDVAVSPDGKSVYAVAQDLNVNDGSFAGGGVAIFNRDSAGALTQAPATAGCIVEPGSIDTSCAVGRGLIGVASVAVAPDNRNVYTAAPLNNPGATNKANTGSSAVAVFDRDLTPDATGTPSTFGHLSQPSGGDGCVSSQSTDGCVVVRALMQPGYGAHSLVLSPTGSFLYAAAATSQSVAVFGRQASDLRLSAAADPGPYTIGHDYNLVLSVLNAGALAADHVTLTDILTAGAAVVSATPSQGTCAINPTVCSLGTVPVNGTATVTVRFRPTFAGTPTNTARVGADQGDASPADNMVSTSLASGTTALTVVGGSGQTTKVGTPFAAPIKAVLKDANGAVLSGAQVTFTAPASGASALFGSATSETVITDASGTATSSTPTANSTVGSYNVTVSSAGAASKTASLTNSLTGTSGSPSPSGSSGGQRLTLALSSPSTITPGTASGWRGTGVAGRDVTLRCYSRTPANSQPGSGTPTYGDARQAVTGSNGVVTFSLSPGTNTRCFLKYAGVADSDASTSDSIAQNVATALSLSAYRDGVRRYHFQGTNLPRRAGQLITLYRYATGPKLDKYCVPSPESYGGGSSGSCVPVRTATAMTSSTNVWRIDRTFTGSGQFYFVARTSSTLTNVAGFSNQRLTVIH